ncbi:MAG: eukaryotic-like serine/threonine-protein kinase [Myxococcales bacterium]|nr:eukaryotic-like serine/threonine-protein kinase [Myxococcales bacterium]
MDDSPAHSRRGRADAPLSNDRIIDGKYELHGVLGEGGTGIVYDAIRTADQSPVALKVMHAHLAGDLQIRGRFQREATILKRLEGDHICPILELGEVPAQDGVGESLLYMALPKLEGPTLEHVLEKDGPIAVERALDVMLEVCAALRVAHAQGVIHRDLKPANVILESGKKAVVVDFGMSKIVTGSAGGTTNLTAHNMVFGTPEYMSPEQARGDELDARCDVYAAGVMLYEMLAGSHPFTGSTPLNVLTEHLTGVLEPPSKRAKDGRVTPALESVVLHALARDRDERYPSASALAAAIMHARARPDDVVSLSPSAFATSPAGTDAFAVTMPAIGVSLPAAISSAPAPLSEPTSDTLLASGPPAATSTKPPASPSRAPISGSRSSSKSPSKNPSSAPGSIPSVRPVIEEGTTGTWILLWVVAGLVSIGIGVYFALR